MRRKLLTIPQVKAWLRVSRSTVYRWLDEGHIEGVRFLGCQRVYEDSVERMLEREGQ